MPVRQPKYSRSAPSALVAFGVSATVPALQAVEQLDRVSPFLWGRETGRGLDEVELEEAVLLRMASERAHA